MSTLRSPVRAARGCSLASSRARLHRPVAMRELHASGAARRRAHPRRRTGRRASPSVALSRVKTRRDSTWAGAWSFMWLGDVVMSPPDPPSRSDGPAGAFLCQGSRLNGSLELPGYEGLEPLAGRDNLATGVRTEKRPVRVSVRPEHRRWTGLLRRFSGLLR